MQKTAEIVHSRLDFLPLTTNAFIVEGNALRLDWNEVVDKSELNYIMGNPPFVGARLMSKAQKDDLLDVFGKIKNIGNLDYVSGWYKKATDYIETTTVETALVSTNSVTQGEQPAILFKPLFERGIHINFCHRTFRWDSEASIKAHVHCVIIGFSYLNKTEKYIFESDRLKKASNINAYLIDSDDVFVESRTTAISADVPTIGIGNKPIDGGNYLFTEDEMNDFIKSEPKSKAYFKPWYGSQEFINNKSRYCLWLGDCSPSELRSMPKCLERVQNVREFRLASSSAGTRKIADKPTRFHVENMPIGNYILIPKVSSEKRRYSPIGFMDDSALCSDLVFITNSSTLYDFGILTSNVHMAWMRAVCGRLEMRYRYSKDIVYNNYPWPSPNDEQKRKIEKTAKAILDARANYPDCSYADLYDIRSMPFDLLRAHQENDRAVMQAYGFSTKMTESECVAELMKMYSKFVEIE